VALVALLIYMFWSPNKTILFVVYVPWLITVLYRNYRARKSVSDPAARYKTKASPGKTA